MLNFTRNSQNVKPAEKIREPEAQPRILELVDKVPRRTVEEFEDDLRRYTIAAADAYDQGMYGLAERTLVRLAFMVASHHGDMDARDILAGLRFVHREEASIRLSPATPEAV